jgi:Asp-tRNA(Asn)/Glu-tRNA(Gln) amidotransferase A subunit family amidase
LSDCSEQYRSAFLQSWLDHKLDLLLTVPNATPATPHDGLGDSFASCGYTFLFNLVDYPAGVLPVTKVDPVVDALPRDFRPRNHVEKGAYKNYQAEKMAGLPVGVQVIGRRLEEEWTLKGMELVEEALNKMGVRYEG